MASKIVITKFPLETDNEEVNELKNDDEKLIQVIDRFQNTLDDDEEVFSREKNLLATNKSWYGSFYADNLKKVDDT